MMSKVNNKPVLFLVIVLQASLSFLFFIEEIMGRFEFSVNIPPFLAFFAWKLVNVVQFIMIYLITQIELVVVRSNVDVWITDFYYYIGSDIKSKVPFWVYYSYLCC